MTFAQTPIYPAKTANQQANVPSASPGTTTIYTADSTYGAYIRGINSYAKGNAGARTVRLELVNNGATKTTVLGRFTLGATQYLSENVLVSTKLPFIDDNLPKIILGPGEKLNMVTEDSNANALDVTVFADSYELPA